MECRFIRFARVTKALAHQVYKFSIKNPSHVLWLSSRSPWLRLFKFLIFHFMCFKSFRSEPEDHTWVECFLAIFIVYHKSFECRFILVYFQIRIKVRLLPFVVTVFLTWHFLGSKTSFPIFYYPIMSTLVVGAIFFLFGQSRIRIRSRPFLLGLDYTKICLLWLKYENILTGSFAFSINMLTSHLGHLIYSIAVSTSIFYEGPNHPGVDS